MTSSIIQPTELPIFCRNACDVDSSCRGAKWADLELQLSTVAMISSEAKKWSLGLSERVWRGDHCTVS